MASKRNQSKKHVSREESSSSSDTESDFSSSGSDIEEAAAAASSRNKVKKLPSSMVISLSRRTDVPGNPEMLESVLDGIRNGVISYPKPRFGKVGEMCEVSLKETEVLSFWSKDFKLFLDVLENAQSICPELLDYKLHLTFTINNEKGCILEPGITTTIDERCDQLRRLVKVVTTVFKQPANESIMVHIDPISVWEETVAGGAMDPIKHNNLGHLPRLVAVMKELGLSRMHISFTQFGWRKVAYRLKSFKSAFTLHELTLAQQRKLVDTELLPITGADVRVQTCSGAAIVQDYKKTPRADGLAVHKGACVGRSDIEALVGRALPPVMRTSREACNANCTCYRFRDAGPNTKECTHGCRYCFGKPKPYPLVAPSGTPEASASSPCTK